MSKALQLLALLALLSACSHTDEETPRARAAGIMAVLSQHKVAIEAYVKKYGTLKGAGQVVELAPSLSPLANIRIVFSSSVGEMVAYDADWDIVVFVQPHLEEGSLSWQCTVVPHKASPSVCR